nr:hypothetical protein [Desulfotignum balticum]
MPDNIIARYLLLKMHYVSLELFESWLQNEILTFVQNRSKLYKNEFIALFPVKKPTTNIYNQAKEDKPVNDSSGRIAHALKNIERNLPNHVELTPRLKSMRDSRVKHIVFVDDFIGTGDRFIKFWDNFINPSILSWCSFGWCKLWVITYAAHKEGINRIVSKIKPISTSSFLQKIKIKHSFIRQKRDLRLFCSKYAHQIYGEKVGTGYGNLFSPIIFQHGCPNNVPSIFWKKGNAKGTPWNPLFPNRSIPKKLYSLFTKDYSHEISYESLWMANNYRLALKLVDTPLMYIEDHHFLLILSYLKQKKSIENIKSILILGEDEFAQKLQKLLKYGLIDPDNNVTTFGVDILNRGRKPKAKELTIGTEYINHFPKTFMGFQRGN